MIKLKLKKKNIDYKKEKKKHKKTKQNFIIVESILRGEDTIKPYLFWVFFFC